ncbi:MAG: hypothetical protein ACRC9L_06160, partial [Brevinema sp.]
ISFIVEPYSLFLAYEIKDDAQLMKSIPEDYELVESAMFNDTIPRKCVIIGAFNVHTSVFWGNRVEVYIIARHKKTGFVSWLIQEYETNTISYDPGRGFIPPGTKHSILTTSFLGEVILDVEGETSGNKIQVNANLKKGEWKELTQSLWIEGNLSVDYGNSLSDVKTKPFALIFDPEEMREALSISPTAYQVIENTFLQGIIETVPFEVCCFPFAQHFYTTSMPLEHSIKNRADLEQRIVEINQAYQQKKSPFPATPLKPPCPGYCYSYGCKNSCRLREKE